MKIGAHGLKAVKTSDLKTLLKYVHKGEARCPITVEELARCGLQHAAEALLPHLRGLPKEAGVAVLVAVIAERI